VISDRRQGIALVLFAILFSVQQVCAQDKSSVGKNEVYTGYGLLSNSFNAYALCSSASPMNGWDLAVSRHFSGPLSITVDALGLYGKNCYASQIEHNVLVGPQWSWHAGRESLFVHGLTGLGFINSGAIPFDHSGPSSNVVFAALAGGGVDISLSHNLAWRIEGDYLRAQYGSNSDQIHDLRGNFAHVTTGLVIRF